MISVALPIINLSDLCEWEKAINERCERKKSPAMIDWFGIGRERQPKGNKQKIQFNYVVVHCSLAPIPRMFLRLHTYKSLAHTQTNTHTHTQPIAQGVAIKHHRKKTTQLPHICLEIHFIQRRIAFRRNEVITTATTTEFFAVFIPLSPHIRHRHTHSHACIRAATPCK